MSSAERWKLHQNQIYVHYRYDFYYVFTIITHMPYMTVKCIFSRDVYLVLLLVLEYVFEVLVLVIVLEV